MTDSDYRSDSLPVSADDAVEILQQADVAAQAGISLSAGLRAMASESISQFDLLTPLALAALTLNGLAFVLLMAWIQYISPLMAYCTLFGAIATVVSFISYLRTIRSRNALLEMARRLDSGEPMPQVLATMRARVSPMILTLFKNGVALGRFDTALHWAAEQGHQRRSLQWTLWFALSYPLFLLFVGGCIGTFAMVGIVPGFKQIFYDFGTELPDMTRVILNLSDFMVNYGTTILTVILIAFAILVPLIIAKGNWLVTRRWSPYIPVVGAMFHLETLSEFCNLLAVFMDCRMPVPVALRTASNATRDMWLQTACNRLATDIEQGHSSDSSAMSAGIPIAISKVLRESSTPTAVAEALRGLATLYSTRAEVNSRFVAVIAEPFIIIMTAVSLGTTIAALYMPLIKLLNDLS